MSEPQVQFNSALLSYSILVGIYSNHEEARPDRLLVDLGVDPAPQDLSRAIAEAPGDGWLCFMPAEGGPFTALPLRVIRGAGG